MGKLKITAAKGCGILAAVIIGVPLLVVGIVGVKTWGPLQAAGDALDELDRSLGPAAVYVPAPSGVIPAERLEIFLVLRAALVEACGDYGHVQRGVDAISGLETRDPEEAKDPEVVGGLAYGLGGTALNITPFLARYFELRNTELLAASMGLEEYVFIYAVAYHDQLLDDRTRGEIFSAGEALSPEASLMLRGCLERQAAALERDGGDDSLWPVLVEELRRMEDDPARLVWQDGLPEALGASVASYREDLDALFCGATAGLEMERDADRALRIALE